MSITYPTLYAYNRKGGIKQWSQTPNEEKDGSISTRHGLLGKKIQERTKLVKGKNAGKKNATTDAEQAIKEVLARYTKQRQAGYTDDPDNIQISRLPMLAKSYKSWKGTKAIQPKLDGMRCLVERVGNEIQYKSRTLKDILTMSHLTPHLLKMLRDGERFDGELYIHGLELRHILKLVKKERFATTDHRYVAPKNPEDEVPFGYISSDVQFWVYDMPDDDTPFEDRAIGYTTQITEGNEDIADYDLRVSIVHTETISSEDEMKRLHDVYIGLGFEGTILRVPESLYEWGHRSPSLIKYKEFFDAEFMIVGAETSESGTDEGCVKWVCETTDKKHTFIVRPRGSVEARQSMWENKETYFGKMLTVRYQTLLSETNKPQFGVGIAVGDGIAIRNYD